MIVSECEARTAASKKRNHEKVGMRSWGPPAGFALVGELRGENREERKTAQWCQGVWEPACSKSYRFRARL